MATMTKRDTRGTEIKRLLQGLYPHAQFRVRLEKYSMGESIHVYTDLLEEGQWSEDMWKIESQMKNHEDVSEGDYKAYQAYKAMLLKNTETQRKLKADLVAFEHVDRDSQGEILGGGNTYLHIHRLTVTPGKPW